MWRSAAGASQSSNINYPGTAQLSQPDPVFWLDIHATHSVRGQDHDNPWTRRTTDLRAAADAGLRAAAAAVSRATGAARPGPRHAGCAHRRGALAAAAGPSADELARGTRLYSGRSGVAPRACRSGAGHGRRAGSDWGPTIWHDAAVEVDPSAADGRAAGRDDCQAPEPEPLPGARARAGCCSSNVRGGDEDAEAQAPDQLAGDRGGGARARIVGEPRPKPVPWAPPRWALALTAVSTPPEPLVVAVALVIIFLVVVVVVVRAAAALALTLAAPQPLRHRAAGGQPLRPTPATFRWIAAWAAAHTGARPVARVGPRAAAEAAPPRRGARARARRGRLRRVIF